MKTCLKRSEIIEQLKRFFPEEKSISIVLDSVVRESEFSIFYFVLVKFETCYQVVNIHLNYGWIEYEVCNAYSSAIYRNRAKAVAFSEYFREMRISIQELDKKHDCLPF